MFRVSDGKGGTRQSRSMRWLLSISYFCFAAAGYLLFISPTVTEFYGEVSYAYTAFLAIGGLLSLFGTATGRWIGEFLGLPLVASGIAAFGYEVLMHSGMFAPYLAYGNFLLLMAVTFLMLTRWRIALAAYRAAHATAKAVKRGLQ